MAVCRHARAQQAFARVTGWSSTFQHGSSRESVSTLAGWQELIVGSGMVFYLCTAGEAFLSRQLSPTVRPSGSCKNCRWAHYAYQCLHHPVSVNKDLPTLHCEIA